MSNGNQAGGSGDGKRKAVAALIGAALLGGGAYLWLAHKEKTAAPPGGGRVAAGGEYDALSAEQRRLVDDWTSRFSDAFGKKVSARQLYDDLPLSTKTTFYAVTHALSRTPLTGPGEQPLNLTALELVERLEQVAGSFPGKSGDKQFRIYAQVKPQARETLEKSREFSRQPDNTIYHKGYPICFRGATGTPSIQFSLSREGNFADIDVDYRSSTFPVMLVNGHLTASNSDVRAGDNDQRHNAHWQGLKNWWGGILGVPLYENGRIAEEVVGTQIAREPRLGKGTKPEAAVHDFLEAWLVEQKPGIALGYVSPRAYACMQLRNGEETDPGVARFRIFRALEAASKLAGKPAKASDAVIAVNYDGPRGEMLKHAFEREFSMYELREDLAAQLDCESRLHPEQADLKTARSTRFGGSIGATFRLQTSALRGETVATVWAEEDGTWKLVSYESGLDAAGGKPVGVRARPAEQEAPLPVIAGDPGMIRAAAAFFEELFVKKDARAAMARVSRRCLPCYNVYRAEAMPEAATPADAGRLLEERLQLLGQLAGEVKELGEALTAAEPHHAELKLVRHKQQAAFAIVSIPDSMGDAADCARLKRGVTPRFAAGAAGGYGKYYAASIRLRRAGDEGAVLWTVWRAEGGQWKIASYVVVTP